MVKKISEKEKKYENYGAFKRARVAMIKRKLPQLLEVDEKQILKAVKALKKIKNNKEGETQDLFDIGDKFIYLEIVLNKLPIKYTVRPVQIPLVAPIYSQEMNSKFCIFSKNPQREYKNKIADLDIPLIQKVIGYNKILKKFPQYNDMRKLFYEYDMFFCDKSIYSLMAKKTGKIFYQRKKIPYPIDCEEQDQKKYEEYLNKLGNSTYFIQGNGPSYTVKVGRMGQSDEDIQKNIVQCAYGVLPYLLYEPGMNLSCIRSLSIKLSNSMSIPFMIRLSQRELDAWKKEQK